METTPLFRGVGCEQLNMMAMSVSGHEDMFRPPPSASLRVWARAPPVLSLYALALALPFQQPAGVRAHRGVVPPRPGRQHLFDHLIFGEVRLRMPHK